MMAIAGLTVAHELGFAPPRDLSLVGYEDSELAAHVYPPLTSVRSDPVTWGRAATRVLLDAIDGRATDVGLEPARLVVRASTARSPSNMKPYLVGTLIATTVFAAACGGGGGGGSTGEAAQARGPIKIWYSNNEEEVAWGKSMVEAWNAAHPNEKVTGQEIPAGKCSEEVIGAAITAGTEPCLIYNTSPAAVPGFQKQGGLINLTTSPTARPTSRPAAERPRSSTSHRMATTTSCPGRPTR